MSAPVVRVENLSKLYRLGEIGTGTISHDLNRWWHKFRGRADPYATIGRSSDRSSANNEYVWALQDVTFDIECGQVFGVIGRNGAGKSTLLKILSRVTAPSSGEIKVKGRIASLLEVGTGFHPELTGRDNIYLNGSILGMRRSEIRKKLDDIVSFSECGAYIDTPVKRYSSGMYVRLAFAVAAHLESEILIIDEVLAVGDAEFQKRCMGKMQGVAKSGRTVIFVSHNMAAVGQLCNQAILISKGRQAYNGLPADAIRLYLSNSSGKSGAIFNREPEPNLETPKLTHASVVDSLGQPASVVNFESGPSIILSFYCPREVRNLEISFRLFHDSGAPILTSNLSDLDPAATKMRGKGWHSAEIRLPGGLFMPGSYYINIALHEPNVVLYDFQENALQFEIAETGSAAAKYGQGAKEMGFLSLNLEWKESLLKEDEYKALSSRCA